MSETDKATKREPVTVSSEALALAPSASLWLDRGAFEHVQRIAIMLSESDMVPDHFRKKTANCAIAVQLAMRLDVDPFALMQRLYMVHGKPGIEAQVVIALVNRRGPFTGPIEWEFAGQPGTDSRQCTAFATLRASGRRAEVTIGWATVKAEGWLDKAGSKWKTMPDQMFRYRTAAWLARLYCPDVLMGMSTADELADMGAIPTTATPVAGPLRPPAGAPEVTATETTAQQQ